MESTKKMIDLLCSTGAEKKAAGAGCVAIERGSSEAVKILEEMSSSILTVRCDDCKQARPATAGAIKLAGFSLIALLAVVTVACGYTNPANSPTQSLGGDWSILFTVDPSGYTDPGNATFSVDSSTGDIAGSISLTTEANDPGTFDVAGTLDESTGAFTFSFAGTCAADDSDVTATLSGVVSGSSMSGDWTESASSGGWCEAGSGTFDGTSSASPSYHSAVRKAKRAGEAHSDRIFMRGVVPRHTH